MEEPEKRGVDRHVIREGLAVYCVLTVCALASILPAFLADSLPAAGPARPTRPANSFRDVRGSDIRFRRHGNTPLVTCFFAPENALARKQLEALKALRGRFAVEELEILALCDPLADTQEVAALAEAVDAPFPVLLYTGKDFDVVKKGGPLPATSIMDAQKKTQRVFRGLAETDDIAAVLEKLKK